MLAPLALVLAPIADNGCHITPNSTGNVPGVQIAFNPTAGQPAGWFMSSMTGNGNWVQWLASLDLGTFRPILYSSDLCLAFPIYRMGPPIQMWHPLGHELGTFVPPLWMAGHTVYFQAHYTDVAVGPVYKQFTKVYERQVQ